MRKKLRGFERGRCGSPSDGLTSCGLTGACYRESTARAVLFHARAKKVLQNAQAPLVACPSRITLRPGMLVQLLLILPESPSRGPVCSGVSTNVPCGWIFMLITIRCWLRQGRPPRQTSARSRRERDEYWRVELSVRTSLAEVRLSNAMIDPVRFRSVSGEPQR